MVKIKKAVTKYVSVRVVDIIFKLTYNSKHYFKNIVEFWKIQFDMLEEKMYQGIVFGAVALLATIIILSFHKVDEKKFDIFLKVVTVLFCGVGVFRYFLSDGFIFAINGGWYGGIYHDKADFWHAVLRWGYATAYSVLPMAVFFKGRFFKNIASYISMPFAVLSTIFFEDYMAYFLSEEGNGIHGADGFRYAYFVIELVIAILIPLLIQIKYKHYFNFKDKREVINFFAGLPLVLLVTIPVYVPQSFFGFKETSNPMFGTYHIVWMIVLLALTLAIYFGFRNRPHREKRMLCVFLAIALFYHFNTIFLMGITLSRLPFQLCNMASYLILIAIVFDLKRMMQFCFLVNVAGTILAIAVAALSDGFLCFWNVHYIFEHSYVLLVPALAYGFELYPRVNKKSMLYAFIGFTAYFLFVFVLGIVLNGYSEELGQTVNYFYMFDTEVAFDYFPFLSFAGNWCLEFGRFSFYPMVVGIVYAGFSASWILFYGLCRLIYRIEDKCLSNRLSRRPWRKAYETYALPGGGELDLSEEEENIPEEAGENLPLEEKEEEVEILSAEQ